MSDFFDKPAPQQAVPADLAELRRTIIRSLLGGGDPNDDGSFGYAVRNAGRSSSMGGGGSPGGVLGALLGFTSEENPGSSSLPALRASADSRLTDQIDQLNASSPGRFSSANLYEQGRLRQRSQEDFNLLSAQVLEQGRNRQLQAILSLLGPALGPSFGGPFTQGASGFENLLGAASTAGQFFNPFNTGGKK